MTKFIIYFSLGISLLTILYFIFRGMGLLEFIHDKSLKRLDELSNRLSDMTLTKIWSLVLLTN